MTVFYKHLGGHGLVGPPTGYAYVRVRTLLTLCVIVPNINYQYSKLGYRRKMYSTLRHSAVDKCKYIRLLVKTGE